MTNPHAYLARILNTTEEVVADLEARLSRVTGESGKFAELVIDNERRVNSALELLELDESASAEDVFGSLMGKVAENEQAVRAVMDNPDPSTTDGVKRIIEFAKEISGLPTGFFLKHEVAVGLLKKNPPEHLLKALNIESVDVLLKEYSLEEVFPSIRFAEKAEWVNTVFFKPFADLTPDDFEEREVAVVTIPDAFREITDKFAEKKLHHVSHLKELGVIFVMPVADGEHGTDGAVLELLTLVQHYLHEVPFYSRIFRGFAKDAASFTTHLVGALRGDVLDELPEGGDGERFMLIQRYLAKVDPNEPRLAAPHVNPEALHWLLVEEKIENYLNDHPEVEFTFWKDLGFLSSDYVFVGHPFKLDTVPGQDQLVSFDFIDNVISYNKRVDVGDGFVYHAKEALWNELFYRYVGREKIDAIFEDRLEEGFFELHK